MFHLGCVLVSIGAIILGLFRNFEVLTLDNDIYNSHLKWYYLIFMYYPAQFGYKLNQKIYK